MMRERSDKGDRYKYRERFLEWVVIFSLFFIALWNKNIWVPLVPFLSCRVSTGRSIHGLSQGPSLACRFTFLSAQWTSLRNIT